MQVKGILKHSIEVLETVDKRLSSLIATDAVHVFEIELLLFPVFVVLLASAALLFGGRCALWQWWTAVALTILVGRTHCCAVRVFCKGTGLFFVSILVLWVACGISIVPLGDDSLRYHLPGIRLLTEGWNPVWQGRWDVITSQFGLDPSETKTLFVLPNAKGVWYLDAVSYFFVGNPFNLMLPAYFLMMMVASVTFLRNFTGVWLIVRVGMILSLTQCVPSCWNSIDAVVGLSGICLLSAMYKCLVRNEWDWFQLLGYSFMMCMAKQTGTFHCLVFWLIFSSYFLMRSHGKMFGRFAVVASILTVSVALVGASPYLSSWKEFGHPLYPKFSIDEEKYPVRDMVSCDFLTRNADAAAMGRIGAYVYSYVSPDVAKMYYRWKLRQSTFEPWCFCKGPSVWTFRMFFCVCLMCLLFLGKKEDRIVAVIVFVGTIAMPTEMIGYARCCPWIEAVVIFTMPVLLYDRCRIPKMVLFCALMLQYGIRPAVALVSDCLNKIAYAKAASDYLERTYPQTLYNGFGEDAIASKGPEYFDLFFSEKSTTKRGDDVNKTSLGNIKLLQRQSSYLAKSRIVDFTMGGSEAERFRASNGTWKSFYDNSFKVAPEDALQPINGAAETALRTFPELVMRRLTGRIVWK